MIAPQDDRRFQRIADQLFLPRVLDRLADHAAQVQQLSDLFLHRGILPAPRPASGNNLEMDRACDAPR